LCRDSAIVASRLDFRWGRSQVFIDTLHPVHEGRLYRRGFGPNESPLLDYGRTSPDALAASGSSPQDVKVAELWRRSAHYKMLQAGGFWKHASHAAQEKDSLPHRL
jgi:adenylate cyclase